MIEKVDAKVAGLMRENDRLNRDLREKNGDLEGALVELAELFAEQDDALVELAAIIEEG